MVAALRRRFVPLLEDARLPEVIPDRERGCECLIPASLGCRKVAQRGRAGAEPGLETRSPHQAVDDECEVSAALERLARLLEDALRSDRATGAASLGVIAGEFEGIGYPLPAADCHAEAAVLARRPDLDPTADEAAARRLYAACSAVPLLGELPEPRMIDTAAARQA